MKLKNYNPDERIERITATEDVMNNTLYAQMARDRFKIYREFLDAGFDPEQAFVLTRDIHISYVNRMMDAIEVRER